MKPVTISRNILDMVGSHRYSSTVGMQLLTCTQFQQYLAENFNSSSLLILNSFYKEHLIEYPLICVEYDKNLSKIRFCVQISDNSQEGYELQFTKYSAKLLRLVGMFDTTISQTVKEWVL